MLGTPRDPTDAPARSGESEGTEINDVPPMPRPSAQAQARTVAVLSTGMRPIHGDDAVRTAWCHQPKLPRPSAKRAPLRPAATSPFDLGRRLRGAKVPRLLSSPPVIQISSSSKVLGNETLSRRERASERTRLPLCLASGSRGPTAWKEAGSGVSRELGPWGGSRGWGQRWGPPTPSAREGPVRREV